MQTIPLTGRYSLRPIRSEEASDIFSTIDTQRRHLGTWLPFVAATHRVEQIRTVVAAMLADADNPVYTLRDGKAFAGLIGFKSADSARGSIEIGYLLREEQQGKGLMTAAVRALCETAFGQMGMRRGRFAAPSTTDRATAFRAGRASESIAWRCAANCCPTELGPI